MEAIFPIDIDIDMDPDTSMPDFSDLSIQGPASPRCQPQQTMFCRPLTSPLTLPSPAQPFNHQQTIDLIEITPAPSPQGLPIPQPEPPKTLSLFHQRHHTPSLMNTSPLLPSSHHSSIRLTTSPTRNRQFSPAQPPSKTPTTPKTSTLPRFNTTPTPKRPSTSSILHTSRFAPSLSGHLTPYPSPVPELVTKHFASNNTSPSKKGKDAMPSLYSHGDDTSWEMRRCEDAMPVFLVHSIMNESERAGVGREEEKGGKKTAVGGMRSALGELGQQRVGRNDCRVLGSPFDDEEGGNEAWEGDDEGEGERGRRGTRVWLAECDGGGMGQKATRVRGDGVYV